jgi:hypothetical protein
MRIVQAQAACCLLVSVIACGGSSGSAPASNGSAPAASNAPASTFAASSSQASSGKVELVAHERLKAFLPTLPGWTREGDPKGTTDPAEGVSRVVAQYNHTGGGGVSIEIMDTMSNPKLLEILKEDLKSKETKVAGFPALQDWRSEIGSGTITVLVADRFVVGITGTNVSEFAVLQKTVDAIDLRKLAALK